ncbi:MAG: hypothetical protein KAH03_02035 [Cocleimonas sp.]|nr:hypothetical protein [Cocleimonas sp.]
MNREELKIVKQLDDGSLYADPLLIEEMFRYNDMLQPSLHVHRNEKGQAVGYLPVGYYYRSPNKGYILSYIASMPNSPPVSPTYTPGAESILKKMKQPYFDSDVVADFSCAQQQPTASLYGMPLQHYWQFLSASRRKDLRRKLRKSQRFTLQVGSLVDVRNAWHWMQQIWDQRNGRFGSTPYEQYLETTLSWLTVLEKSQRARLKIDKYMLGNRMVGINCCAIHHYNHRYHCDDYLTWYDPHIASGLGIVSAVKNFTHPDLTSTRYNLSTPSISGNTITGHQYKWDIIPEALRLTQSVMIVS